MTVDCLSLDAPTMTSTLRVSICGAGIGGLTLALVISKYGHLPVDVYEAGPTITTVGAGISIFPRTMEIIKEMGLYDELVKLTIKPPEENTGIKFRKADQLDGYYWFTKTLQRGYVPLHRKDLVDLLLRHIPASCKIHTSKRLEFYNVDPASGEIALHFSDGSSVVTDVLVGADGIRSTTRKTMYETLASSARDDDTRKTLLECIDAVWTGKLVYRSLIPTTKLVKEFPGVPVPIDLTMHLGKKKHIAAYPISHGTLINVVIYIHNDEAFGTPFEGRWMADVSEKEVADQFEDWEISTKAIAKCVENPSRWALHSVRPLLHYVDGKVAILGDAAHAMEPHFGAGAGQAMEDAFVLGRLLTHACTHRGNVGEALKTYEEVCLPFGNNIVQRSRDLGRRCALQPVGADGALHPQAGSHEELEYIRKLIEDAWEWQAVTAPLWSEAEERWRVKCSAHSKV